MTPTQEPIPPFAWFYRPDPVRREDHVISLCAGHAYLTEKGGWKCGAGDLAHVCADASQCCVCNGFVTVKRMKNAPLKAPTLKTS